VVLMRRAGAPRLIEWTGERCVPWSPDVAVVYEHFHRYLWAARALGGARVLDLGSGEGFGAAILAGTAADVVGIDIDEPTVAHSTANYAAPNLSFRVASALDLSSFEPESFDAVVSFEMIEHVDEQVQVMTEIARVLARDGLLIMSTPDRRAYSDATEQKNPYHKKELELEEFVALLRGWYPHVACWGQRIITGSRIDSLEGNSGATSGDAEFFLRRAGDEWVPADASSPLYLIALASKAPLPAAAATSTLSDFELQLLRAQEHETNLASAEVQRLRTEAAGRAAEAETLRQDADSPGAEAERLRIEVARARAQVEDTRTEYARDLAEHSAATRAQREHADAQTARVRRHFEGEIARLGDQQEENTRLRARVRRTDESVTWRAFEAARARLHGAIGGENSGLAQAVSLCIRLAGRRLARRDPLPPPAPRPPPPPPPRITFPSFTAPQVSLLIAIHARADLTERCLASILAHTTGVSYEVILLDDAADPETKALLARVDGTKQLVNETNLGFLRSVNRGAETAIAPWLVVMNNDVEATSGWLCAMLDCAESAPDVGVVTPKYVYPDGRLQEAGALIWRDGTGANVGRGENPGHCMYNYRRGVDYGSGGVDGERPVLARGWGL